MAEPKQYSFILVVHALELLFNMGLLMIYQQIKYKLSYPLFSLLLSSISKGGSNLGFFDLDDATSTSSSENSSWLSCIVLLPDDSWESSMEAFSAASNSFWYSFSSLDNLSRMQTEKNSQWQLLLLNSRMLVTSYKFKSIKSFNNPTITPRSTPHTGSNSPPMRTQTTASPQGGMQKLQIDHSVMTYEL